MLKRPIFIAIGIFAAVVVLLTLLIPKQDFENFTPREKAEYELLTNQSKEAENTLKQIAQRGSFNVDDHYQYIRIYFSNMKKGINITPKYIDETEIFRMYKSFTQNPNDDIVDIGYYGMGLIKLLTTHFNSSLKNFERVRNEDMPYLNNGIGLAYLYMDSVDLAEVYFRKEIEINGDIEKAYYNLSFILFRQDRTAEIYDLLNDKELNQYVAKDVKRLVYFNDLKIFRYGISIFSRAFSSMNLWGVLAALLIVTSWLIYLRNVDILGRRREKYVFLMLLLGMIFSFIVEPFTDFTNYMLGISLNGKLLNDFLYCVFGIGFIEELAKIIPVLLLLWFSKAITKPFDYILYASISALGFAFIENLIYFDKSSLQIIHGRALTSTVLHMFASSIIAYGMVLNRFKRRWNPILNFLIFLLLSALAHGFYDFWIINKTASKIGIMSTILLIWGVIMWNTFKNNAINQSVDEKSDIFINTKKIGNYLIYSLVGIFLFEYIALAFTYHPSVANKHLLSSFLSGTYLIVIISFSLSRFTIYKGFWAPVGRITKQSGKINFDEILNCHVSLTSSSENKILKRYIPNSGIVTQRYIISRELDWYLVELDTPYSNDKYLDNQVLIRTKNKRFYFKKDIPTQAGIYLIPKDIHLEKENLKSHEFFFLGWGETNFTS